MPISVVVYAFFPSLVFENAALRVLTHPSNFVILQHKPGTRQLTDVLAGFEQVGLLKTPTTGTPYGVTSA